jgi:hypothetical protein
MSENTVPRFANPAITHITLLFMCTLIVVLALIEAVGNTIAVVAVKHASISCIAVASVSAWC